jgi:hypothetical protein
MKNAFRTHRTHKNAFGTVFGTRFWSFSLVPNAFIESLAFETRLLRLLLSNAANSVRLLWFENLFSVYVKFLQTVLNQCGCLSIVLDELYLMLLCASCKTVSWRRLVALRIAAGHNHTGGERVFIPFASTFQTRLIPFTSMFQTRLFCSLRCFKRVCSVRLYLGFSCVSNAFVAFDILRTLK